MKKLLLPVLVAFLVVGSAYTPALAEPKAAPVAAPAGTASPRNWDKLLDPDGSLSQDAVKAGSAILIDAKTGKVLYEKDADAKRYPASTTKIMTCLLALDNYKDLKKIVTIGTLPSYEKGAVLLPLKSGEQISMEDLIYAMMVKSANDAPDAIAMEVGGTRDKFIDMMNAKAQELGMTNTHYSSPNGLADDPDNHYTTARDMSILARAAMHGKFINVVSTDKYTLQPDNKRTTAVSFTNENKLIVKDNNQYYYKYATGIKTGYTSLAHNALVSTAQKDGMSLIGVLLNEDVRNNLWVDSVTMFEYGFNYYDTLDLGTLTNSQQFSIDVKNAAADDEGGGKLSLEVSAPTSADPYLTDKKDVISKLKSDPSQFVQAQTITKDTAPIKKDDIIGTVSYTFNGVVVMVCNLVASRDVQEMPAATKNPSGNIPAKNSNSQNSSQSGTTNSTSSGSAAMDAIERILPALIWVGAVILCLLLAFVVIRLINIRRRNRKYRQFSYRQGSVRARR